MTITSESFGMAPDGSEATLWNITNTSGLVLGLTDWGAGLVSLSMPDARGNSKQVILSFPEAAPYTAANGYLGATCGRFANRIAGGRFVLDGKTYELTRNDGDNHLHGGIAGFNARLWSGTPFVEGDNAGVSFTYTSADGEERYPGRLTVRADYVLTESGRLLMEFLAETNAPTIVNITNHAYWNLAGIDSGSVLDHELTLFASRYLPVDASAIPLGTLVPVEGTPFDFIEPKRIGVDFTELPGGYDHCFAVDGETGTLRPAARLRDPASGRAITLHTNRPGVQFYTGNFLSGVLGSGNVPFIKHSALCLEPQDFPDAPNRPSFPSTVLRPGHTYHHKSFLAFSVE